MPTFDQKRFDELMTELANLRKRHAEEIASIQKAITKVLFPNE
jgi:hypothetical protein